MLPSLPSFTSLEQAKDVLKKVRDIMPELLTNHLHEAKSVKILHDEPEVWRVWREIWDIRVAIHKIFPCNECFFHPHPWPSVVEILQWGYTHRTAQYNGSPEEIYKLQPDDIEEFSGKLISTESTVVPGCTYYMPDIRQFHQVSTSIINYSLMITGKPYFHWATQQFSRKSPAWKNPSLTEDEFNELTNVAKKYFIQS